MLASWRGRAPTTALVALVLACLVGVAHTASRNCPETAGRTRIPGDPPPAEAIGKWEGLSAYGRLEFTGLKDDAVATVDFYSFNMTFKLFWINLILFIVLFYFSKILQSIFYIFNINKIFLVTIQ